MSYVYYCVADTATGEIVRQGFCESQDVELQAGPGQLVFGSDATWKTHFASGGELVAYTDEQAAAKAAKPGRTFAWSNADFQWHDQRSLDDLKIASWVAVKAARSAVEGGTFVWDGSTFDCDAASTSRVMGAVQLASMALSAGLPWSIDWTLSDNTVRTLSAQDMLGVGAALGTQVAQAFATARALRAQIDAAQSAEELAGIAWPQPGE